MKHEKLLVCPDGMYVEDHTGRRRISASIEVVAFGYYENSNGRFVIIRFDVDNVNTYVVCPSSVLRKAGILLDLLDDQGFDWPLDRRDRQLLLKHLQATKPPLQWTILRRTGWWGNTYVLADRAIGPDAEQVWHEAAFCSRGFGIAPGGVSPATSMLGSAAYLGSAGSLEDWKTIVAAPVSCSSRMILCILSALTAPLMQPLGLENGGFHLFGASSAGKTTASLLARSVFGRAVRAELTHWRGTEAGTETIAMENCDLLLVLDEIAQLDADQVKGGRRVRETVFHLCSGQPKARQGKFNQQLQSPTWRTFILSNGVAPLSDLATAAGLSRDAGDNVRLIDVPLADDRTNIFDRKLRDSAEDELLSRRLENAVATRCYGTAGPALLEQFVERRDKYLPLLERWMADFVGLAGVPETQNGGWERRFVRRFAACYAIGLLAIKFDILPWSEELVQEAVVACYRDARQAIPSADAVLKEGLQRLRVGLNAAQILDAREGLDGIDTEEIAKADGFRRSLEPKKSFLAIKPDVFRAWFDDAQQLQLVLNKLDTEEMLMRQPSRPNTFTKQVKIAEAGGKNYYYCLRGRIHRWLEKQ